jgi:hypothetical protein
VSTPHPEKRDRDPPSPLNNLRDGASPLVERPPTKQYEQELERLQIELLKDHDTVGGPDPLVVPPADALHIDD